MARQNIDEEWKTDPRRNALIKLLGSSRLADGMRVEINWLVLDHKGKPVPLSKFKFIDDYESWVKCELAEIRGDEVHIAGADRYSEFFDKQKVNASKGGKARAAKLKTPKDGRAQKKPKLPKSAQTCPECPSISFSISNSNSNSNNKNTIAQTGVRASEIECVYKKYPRKVGKSLGLKKARVEIKTESDLSLLEKAVENYREYVLAKGVEGRFIKHFSTFMSEWRDWLEPDAGKTEIKSQIETWDEKFLRGEIG